MTLPHGFTVRLADGLIRAGRGQLLVGGSPLTALRLTPAASRLLRGDRLTVTDGATARLADRLLATNIGIPDVTNQSAVRSDEITVVIPVRDRVDQLDRALAAVHPLRCIVVDDASRNSQDITAVTRRRGAQLITLPFNVGPAGARNAGLAHVSTPYIAFVDSDVEVAAASLLALSRHFADPKVHLVGPRVCGVVRSEHPRWFERYDAVASSLTLGRTPSIVRPGAAVAWLPSACLVARSHAVAAGFDDGLRVGEDVDLVWRLVDAGHRVRYEPEVEALHHARPTMRGWLGRMFVYGTGGAGLAVRHGEEVAPAVLTPTYALGAAALLVRRWWSLPIAGGALLIGMKSVHGALPDSSGRRALSARLAVRGLVWAVRQESALLLRHWWPATLLLGVTSRQARRAIVSALAADTAVTLVEHRSRPSQLAVPLLAGRRLGDLAYGAGLWWGAIRAGSPQVLLPRRTQMRGLGTRIATPERSRRLPRPQSRPAAP